MKPDLVLLVSCECEPSTLHARLLEKAIARGRFNETGTYAPAQRTVEYGAGLVPQIFGTFTRFKLKTAPTLDKDSEF